MSATLVCTSCDAELPVEGETTVCDCGASYPTAGLGGGSGGRRAAESEKQVERRCVRLYRALGMLVWETSQYGNPRGMTPGLPDLVVLRGSASPEMPAVLFHEVKRPGGQLRDAQAAFRDACREAGVAHVVGGPEEAANALGLEVS